MDIEFKEKIREQLKADYEAIQSVRKISAKTGISASYISMILNEQADPADSTWIKLSQHYGVKESDYRVITTRNFQNVHMICDVARQEKAMMLISGEAGRGKTTSLMHYANMHQDTIYIQGERELARVFLQRLAEKISVIASHNNLGVIVNRIREKLSRLDNPLIIVDEASKIPPAALLYIREIYMERRLSHAGIVLAGVPSLENDIIKYARLNKKGFSELFDRIQQPFIHLDPPTASEIIAICEANSIDRKYIPYAIKEAERSGSFRSIERTLTNIIIKSEIENRLKI